MKTGPIPTWLRTAGSLTALGSLGGSLGYLAYGAYPALKNAGVTLQEVAAIGGAIGSAVHFMGLPVLRYVFDYVQLGELVILTRVGIVRSDDADRYRRNILTGHFPKSVSDEHTTDLHSGVSDDRLNLAPVNSAKQHKIPKHGSRVKSRALGRGASKSGPTKVPPPPSRKHPVRQIS